LPGLYVHVPFCMSKCPYCDFFSVPTPSLIPEWLKAVDREASLYNGRFSRFDSLYLGGGTPSLLGEQELSTLMEGLFHRFRFSTDSELTIECNPDDITDPMAALFRDLGFNRVSLGVQSFDDRELRFLGRRHDSLQAERAFDHFRRFGFDNVGIDLMYGLPGQAESNWLKTLGRAMALEPDHLSCYQLTIADHTPFGRLRDEGRLTPMGEETERAFFLLTAEYLTAQGYIHYEISNFAKGKECMCRHNWKYWRRTPYLGLGPSAHSFTQGERWWNPKSLSDYCERLIEGLRPAEESERLSPDQEYLEWLSLGFRTKEGLDSARLLEHPRADKTLKELRDSGLVICENERVIPTLKGFLVADSLPLLFC